MSEKWQELKQEIVKKYAQDSGFILKYGVLIAVGALTNRLYYPEFQKIVEIIVKKYHLSDLTFNQYKMLKKILGQIEQRAFEMPSGDLEQDDLDRIRDFTYQVHAIQDLMDYRAAAIRNLFTHWYAEFRAEIQQENSVLGGQVDEIKLKLFEELDHLSQIQIERDPLSRPILSGAFTEPDAWINLGLRKIEIEKDYDGAEKCFRQAIELDPAEPVPWFNLGVLMTSFKENFLEAERYYRRAIDLAPDYAKAWYNLGAIMQDIKHDYAEAEKCYLKALEFNPNDAMALGGLADIHENVKEDYPKAVEYYRKTLALGLKPGSFSSQLCYNLGSLLSNDKKNLAEAEQCYRKALEYDPNNVDAWNNLGFLLFDAKKNYKEAERCYRRALEINPNDALLWVSMGELLEHAKKDYPEAERCYRKALECNPEEPLAWSYLGKLMEKLGKKKEAQEYLQKARNLSAVE